MQLQKIAFLPIKPARLTDIPPKPQNNTANVIQIHIPFKPVKPRKEAVKPILTNDIRFVSRNVKKIKILFYYPKNTGFVLPQNKAKTIAKFKNT